MTGEQQTSPKLIRDLMTVGVFTCPQETPVVDLVRVMLEKDVEAAVVLDKKGHAVGIVSQDELVRAYGLNNYETKTAEEIMNAEMPQVPPDIPLNAAAQIMQDKGVRALFLTHNAAGIIYPAAVISYKHFLRHMAKEEGEELKDLGIRAERKSPMESYIERRDQAREKNIKRENNPKER